MFNLICLSNKTTRQNFQTHRTLNANLNMSYNEGLSGSIALVFHLVAVGDKGPILIVCRKKFKYQIVLQNKCTLLPCIKSFNLTYE